MRQLQVVTGFSGPSNTDQDWTQFDGYIHSTVQDSTRLTQALGLLEDSDRATKPSTTTGQQGPRFGCPHGMLSQGLEPSYSGKGTCLTHSPPKIDTQHP